MYSATIDLVAECKKWLRNVAYVKTDGRTDKHLRVTGRFLLSKMALNYFYNVTIV